MSFFQKLDEFDFTNLEIKIVKKNGKFTLSLLPKSEAKDVAIKNIIPLAITGTPAELDENFFEVVSKPLEKSLGIISNIEDYEKASEKAEAEKKEIADKKKQEDEEKKKFSETIKKLEDAIEEIVSAEDFDITKSKEKLQDAVNKVLVMDKSNKLANKWDAKIKEVAPSLFD